MAPTAHKSHAQAGEWISSYGDEGGSTRPYQDTWNGFWQIGQAATVTYGFRATKPDADYIKDSGSNLATFTKFNSAQIVATELALSLWSDVANISFTRVGSGTSNSASTYTDSATMLFGNYNDANDGAGAFADNTADMA